jgi:hypothetical protein
VSDTEPPAVTLRRAVSAMRADAGRRGDPPGSFVLAVADWLAIAAAAQERKLPDESGTVHAALRVARGYLGGQARADADAAEVEDVAAAIREAFQLDGLPPGEREQTAARAAIGRMREREAGHD